MSDGSARKSGWALPSLVGGACLLLGGGVIVLFWGSIAWSWWSLLRDLWALPASVRGIMISMAALIVMLIYWAVQHDKALNRLQERLRELEWRVREPEL